MKTPKTIMQRKHSMDNDLQIRGGKLDWDSHAEALGGKKLLSRMKWSELLITHKLMLKEKHTFLQVHL